MHFSEINFLKEFIENPSKSYDKKILHVQITETSIFAHWSLLLRNGYGYNTPKSNKLNLYLVPRITV
jgi:hypothetical protein